MGDPYFKCRDDVMTMLDTSEGMLETLFSLGERHVNYGKQRRDLKRKLTDLEGYIEDVSESVELAQRNMTTFGISEDEIRSRQEFVRESEGRLQTLRQRLPEQPNKQQRQQLPETGNAQCPPTPDGDSEIQGLLLEQQDARQRQEAELTQLGHAVGRIKEMGVTIETEINEQDTMLDKLGTGVVSVTEKLKNTNKKIDEVVDKMSMKKQYACIILLIVILVVLCVLTIA
eukprot:TRINITY_DN3792_c2_g4_i1.p1 TRINITY_DN3792_c2_g4~~TRINITY_DN3792_c2_g4_i1.p1  ORF type:complete len:229 (+),score=47.22 TRINITY_DN3792_c2_g4_i1:47-733(+)